jgi:hypothetical protein
MWDGWEGSLRVHACAKDLGILLEDFILMANRCVSDRNRIGAHFGDIKSLKDAVARAQILIGRYPSLLELFPAQYITVHIQKKKRAHRPSTTNL